MIAGLERLKASEKESLRIFVPLALVLALGAFFRFFGLDWDEGHHLHPDERFIAMVDDAIKWPQSVWQYFDTTTSPLNPYNQRFGSFVYGTFPLFFSKAVGTLIDMDGYSKIYLLGRALSAAADLGTVIVLFFLGRRLFGNATGLLAATLMSFTVFAIQLSHFFAFDTFTVFFTTLVLYFTTRLQLDGGDKNFILTGVLFGFALASKSSVAYLVIPIAVALAVRVSKQNAPGSEETASEKSFGSLPSRGQIASFALATLLILAIAGLVFRVLQPYAFSGSSFFSFVPSTQFLGDVFRQKEAVDGLIDYPPSHQYAFTPGYIFPLKDMLLWGMGPPLGLAAWIGFIFAIYHAFRARRADYLPLLVWVAFNFITLGNVLAKGMRYFYPIYPPLILFAAFFLIHLWKESRRENVRSTESDEGAGGSSPGGEGIGGRLLGYLRRTSALLPAGWPQQWRQRSAIGLIAIVVLTSFAYSVAYSSIYTRPTTRVAASRWIYENIPRGATIANEHWDDPIPLGLSAQLNAGLYPGLSVTAYDDDDATKLEKLTRVLDQTEYIFVTSNRLYGSIPRLPMRYPLTTEYYRLLFDGKLGFNVVKTFASYPSLFGVDMNDDRGMEINGLRAFIQPDETFTVYDHPKVLIFKKTPDYSPLTVRELLGRVSLENVVRVTPVMAPRFNNGLMLDESDKSVYEKAGTWYQMFDPSDIFNRYPLIFWWLAVALLGLAVFPIVFAALKSLPDVGYPLSKAFGLLLLAYVAWMLSSLRLFQYTRGTIIIALLLLLCVSAVALARQKESIAAFARTRWRFIVLSEIAFYVLFLGFYLIRIGNPDLWHPYRGGEKPMDFAYLNAVMRSAYFPPYDPWFAGGYLNYYYFGFVIVGSLIKLTGIVPEVAYNLAIPLLFALTGTGAFAVGSTVTALLRSSTMGQPLRELSPKQHGAMRYFVGFVALVFVSIIGNLGELSLITKVTDQLRAQKPGGIFGYATDALNVLINGRSLPVPADWWYWNPSRIIPNTINEFPFFTYLYADLHAHAIALPITLLALALAVGLLVHHSVPPPLTAFSWRAIALRVSDRWPSLLMLGLVTGALGATNTWDLPTYIVLTGFFLLLEQYVVQRRIDFVALGVAALRLAGVGVLAMIFFSPFFKWYSTPYSSFALWTGDRTHLGDFIWVHGLFLFVLVSLALLELRVRWPRISLERLVRLSFDKDVSASPMVKLNLSLAYDLSGLNPAMIFLVVAAAVVFLISMKMQLIAVLFLLLAITAMGTLSRRIGLLQRISLALFGVGLALTLFVELIVLKGDIGRMNTVFKFYLQVWVIWGIASAFALVSIFARLRHHPRRRFAWSAVFGALLFVSLLYPALATQGRLKDRFGPPALTNNGMEYMRTVTLPSQKGNIKASNDLEAINWLRNNVQGSPVILEANGPLYGWTSRVSIYTGMPTVVGWDWHQKQQRGGMVPGFVEKRLADVEELYKTTSEAQAEKLLARYGVSYVYIGELERLQYPQEGLVKFDRLNGKSLDIVYQNEGTKIFRVRR